MFVFAVILDNVKPTSILRLILMLNMSQSAGISYEPLLYVVTDTPNYRTINPYYDDHTPLLWTHNPFVYDYVFILRIITRFIISIYVKYLTRTIKIAYLLLWLLKRDCPWKRGRGRLKSTEASYWLAFWMRRI